MTHYKDTQFTGRNAIKPDSERSDSQTLRDGIKKHEKGGLNAVRADLVKLAPPLASSLAPPSVA